MMNISLDPDPMPSRPPNLCIGAVRTFEIKHFLLGDTESCSQLAVSLCEVDNVVGREFRT